jgi:hypothetical protein
MKFSKFVRKRKNFSKKRLQRPQIEFCNTLRKGGMAKAVQNADGDGLNGLEANTMKAY